MKNILMAVTGAVSAAAMPSFIMHLRKELNSNVTVMVSRNATKFVTPYSLQLYSGNTVYTDMYEADENVLVPHIKLTQNANIMVVMPASCNIIAKAANGICDDLISTSIVAAEIPVLFVPSMNERMWFNAGVQHNVERLKECGHYILEPEKGVKVEGAAEVYGAMASLKTVLGILGKFLA